jgi:hypothetical protein
MRIVALEKEVARYKAEVETTSVQTSTESSPEELLRRIEVLEKVCRFVFPINFFSKIKYLATNFPLSKWRLIRPTSKVKRKLSSWSSMRRDYRGYKLKYETLLLLLSDE